jgi:uncharacterized membrane protein
MKTLRAPAIVFAAICLGFLCYLAATAPLLPERVAMHFDGNGRPNGWMSRSSYLLFTGAFGLGPSLFLAGIFFAIRYMPVSSFSLPRRDYWLAPERRSETFAYFLRHGLWLAGLVMVLTAGVHYMVIQANAGQGRLPATQFWILLGCFVAAIAVWIFKVIRHFMKAA